MSFTSLLNEIYEIVLEQSDQSRYDVLVDKWAKPKKKASGKVIKPKIDIETLKDLMLADPTTKDNTAQEGVDQEVTKVGAYSQWIIKQWMGLQQEADQAYAYGSNEWGVKLEQLQEQFMEDLYKVTDDLLKFDYLKKTGRYKGEKDINQIKSIDDLYDQVKDYSISKDELTTTKAERAEMEVHPGAKMGHDGSKWQVVEIHDNPMGKEAACYYGGQNRETRWCTSSPGLNYYDRYIKDGPLYVVMDKTDTEVSKPQGSEAASHKQTGLPKKRYQFHFPSTQFMDIDDRQINLEEFLNSEGIELKEYFKHEFADALTDQSGENIAIHYPNDKISRFIALYGMDEFVDKLPSNLQRFDFDTRNREKLPAMPLPKRLFTDFPQLRVLHIEGILEDIPQEIGQLQNLQFLSIPDNPQLKSLPESLATLPNLEVINVRNTPVEIPPALEEKWKNGEIVIVK